MLHNNTLINKLNIKLFADLAEIDKIHYWQKVSFIKGITTNPSLLVKAGIGDYEKFAREITENTSIPISFEVLADDVATMIAQAKLIHSWGKSIFVKIPVVNCQGVSTRSVIQALTSEGIAVNITAIMERSQIDELLSHLNSDVSLIFSVFCGRIADTGRDPVPVMRELADLLFPYKNIQLLWASPREILNIFQANDAGCDIITLTAPLLNKLNLLHKNLLQYSIETVQEFYHDGQKVSFKHETGY